MGYRYNLFCILFSLILLTGCDETTDLSTDKPARYIINDAEPIKSALFDTLQWNTLYSDFENMNNVQLSLQNITYGRVFNSPDKVTFGDNQLNKLRFELKDNPVYKSTTGYRMTMYVNYAINKFGPDKYPGSQVGSNGYQAIGIINNTKEVEFYINSTKLTVKILGVIYEYHVWGKFKFPVTQ